jgi:hypothetical protein
MYSFKTTYHCCRFACCIAHDLLQHLVAAVVMNEVCVQYVALRCGAAVRFYEFTETERR